MAINENLTLKLYTTIRQFDSISIRTEISDSQVPACVTDFSRDVFVERKPLAVPCGAESFT